jgi:hypothetical protein
MELGDMDDKLILSQATQCKVMTRIHDTSTWLRCKPGTNQSVVRTRIKSTVRQFC